MSKSRNFIGIGIASVAIIMVFLFTNIFDLAEPAVGQYVVSAKENVSQVDGEDVVSGAELLSSSIANETSKIKIQNPLP
ncbi:hypothetical protein NKOR_03325 [Candidatus Nitrosopumilus koreensis AR1]|uniref:Uncharacterized protein n=1 Tax=Candidatus Nitrosopumilus koreensis AR1 TaxID=1229908 RepID=K0B535_9ARCH|nr:MULTISPECIES: hypothetical protein [Nitrosopumilus]AFS80559.1 hypothetical protein NKOR_03325 [Candidatus Nitrosopumilus koreensis AR1]